jgi:hypothetical protein
VVSYEARIRTNTLAAGRGVTFRSATLVENYNAPNMLKITGRQDELGDARIPGYGLMLNDDTGARRFSGLLTSVEELGDGTCNLIYTGDLVLLWWRICYPTPAADWATAGQTSAYDVLNDDAETKLIYYVNRNAGPGARAERRFATLTMPASLGRGPAGVSSVRYDILGQLAATLAEQAGLRVEIVQSYSGFTPRLDMTLAPAPNLSTTYRFGTAASAPLQVDQGWRIQIDIPTVTTALSAAGGEGTARLLNKSTSTDAESLWHARIEGFVDQRQTTDVTEVTNGLADALKNGAGPTAVSVPLPDNAVVRGIPLGAQLTVKLGNATIVDRLRQRTTEINGDADAIKVTGVLGDPSAGVKTPTQRQLAEVRARVQNLERR